MDSVRGQGVPGGASSGDPQGSGQVPATTGNGSATSHQGAPASGAGAQVPADRSAGQDGASGSELVSGPGGAKAKRDIEIIVKILKSMGVEQFDTQVLSQLRDLLYRYTMVVLHEAREVSQHARGHQTAQRPSITLEDVRLAIKFKVTHNNTFSQRPDRAQLEEWAAERNRSKLPKVVNAGIPLPMPRERLTGVNFSIKPQAPPAAVQQHAQPPHGARAQKRPRDLARAAPASQAEVNTTAGLMRWSRRQRPARPATLDWTVGEKP